LGIASQEGLNIKKQELAFWKMPSLHLGLYTTLSELGILKKKVKVPV
jgi:hypothetical protein